MSLVTLDIDGNTLVGPWTLVCGHCNWTSLEVGIKFDKATNLRNQIQQFLHIDSRNENAPPGPDQLYTTLKSFYSSQLSASNPSNPLLTPSGGINYSSPSSLARIMSLYTGLGAQNKKQTPKPQPMRESADPSEGLVVTDPMSDAAAVQKLRERGWAGTTNAEQRAMQSTPQRFVADLLPVATLLRTKKNKRCRSCRHILVKPEAKVQSTRFKIKLIAINYIPTMTLKPSPSSHQPHNSQALPPLRPIQFLLTLKNPMYDSVRITLATPDHNPGPHAHRVTILCPQFEIGANVDLWDDALNGVGGGVGGADAADDRLSLANKYLGNHESILRRDERKVAEAGKVWDKGRNWTTVVLEVVCVELSGGENELLMEDEDVLEIPVFVRMEWDGEAPGADAGMGIEKEKEKIELAYWAVIGAGRIAALKV